MAQLTILFIYLLLTIISNNFHNTLCTKNPNSMEKIPQKFTTTFEGFMPLVDKNYLMALNTVSQKKFSLSMWRYYMAQHLYARLALVRIESGIADDNDRRLASYVFSAMPYVPRAMFYYLREIGHILDSKTSEVYEFDVPVWPNDEGNFGRITSDNHWKYMSLPAPSILAQAMREDYNYTMNLSKSPIWDLKEELRPTNINGNDPGRPTSNLLGWMPCNRLTGDEINLLDTVGINNWDSAVSDSQFQLNTNLLEYINRDVSSVVYSNVKVSPDLYPSSEKKLLSTTQLGWLERIPNKNYPFGRRVYYADRPIKGKTFSSLNETEAEKTLIFGFRVEKTENPSDWSIYDWNEYKNVPKSWIDSRNNIFEFGNISIADSQEISFSFERDARRGKFIEETAPWHKPKKS